MSADAGSAGQLRHTGDQWRQGLADSTIPQEILDRGPEPEPLLEPARFRWRPEHDATHPIIVGVDPLESMLEAFEESGREAGVATRAVLGTWPDVADRVESADVVVCHHAIYRVAEIEDFVAALTARARRRVVIELSAHPPLTHLNPLWKVLHGIDRPDRFVADDAQAVLVAMGLAVEREDIVIPPSAEDVTPEVVAFVRRRLYVGPERDGEIEAFMRARQVTGHRVAALWWPGTAS